MHWNFHHNVPDTSALYTRAVVGELCTGAMSPMTATAGIGGHLDAAWTSMYTEAGIHPEPDNGVLSPATAVFGARLYLNTSLLRRFAEHAIGADPVAFSRQYVGERPDVPRMRATRALSNSDPEKMTIWVDRVLQGPGFRPTELSAQMRTTRPALGELSAAQLAQHIELVSGELRSRVGTYVEAEVAVAVTSEALTRIAEDAGRPSGVGELLSGLGCAASESTTSAWTLSRRISRNSRMHSILTAQAARLTGRLDGGTSDITRLRSAIDALQLDHGHLGPLNWELSGETWETQPRLLLRSIDQLCGIDDTADPTLRLASRTERSIASAQAIRRSLRTAPTALDRFELTLAAATRFREAHRQRRRQVSVLNHGLRLAARELGRRFLDKGWLDSIDQIFMLQLSELAELIDRPDETAETLRMRSYDFHALAALRAPFACTGRPVSPVRWAPGGRTAHSRPRWIGSITGTPVSAGTATGCTRVLGATDTTAGLAAGDVLVIEAGGTHWLPLLPAVSAVVIDDSCALSEIAETCRDLSIPCVTSTVDATMSIPHQQLVRVDGSSGTISQVRTSDHTDASVTDTSVDAKAVLAQPGGCRTGPGCSATGLSAHDAFDSCVSL